MEFCTEGWNWTLCHLEKPLAARRSPSVAFVSSVLILRRRFGETTTTILAGKLYVRACPPGWLWYVQEGSFTSASKTVGTYTQRPGIAWKDSARHRPGARGLISWINQPLPSGSLNETKLW